MKVTISGAQHQPFKAVATKIGRWIEFLRGVKSGSEVPTTAPDTDARNVVFLRKSYISDSWAPGQSGQPTEDIYSLPCKSGFRTPPGTSMDAGLILRPDALSQMPFVNGATGNAGKPGVPPQKDRRDASGDSPVTVAHGTIATVTLSSATPNPVTAPNGTLPKEEWKIPRPTIIVRIGTGGTPGSDTQAPPTPPKPPKRSQPKGHPVIIWFLSVLSSLGLGRRH